MAISTKITLDGEKEYRKQLAEIDAALRQNKAEMEKLSAEYAGNENSVEALTAKGELLSKQMELQEQRVEAVTDRLAEARAVQNQQTEAVEKARAELEKQTAALAAMENAEDTSAEAVAKQRAAVDQAKEALEKQERSLESANKAVQDYELRLTQAETKVIKASNAVEDNSKALEENKNNSKSLGDVLSDLADKAGVKLPEGIQKGTDSINAGTAATAAWAAAAGTMISKLIDATRETAAMTDELATQSIQTGISTDTLQAWNYAAGLMDVEASTVTGSMTKLTRNMAAAQKGSEAQVQAFRRLGVAYKDANGQLRDAEDVWWDTIEALGKIRNESERDTVAMQLFGQSAKDLNTVIAAGREGFEGFRQEAEQMGYIMGAEQIDRFNRLSDAMDRFDNAQVAVKTNLGEALLPMLTSLFELLGSIDPKFLATIGKVVAITTAAVALIKVVNTVTNTLKLAGAAISDISGKAMIVMGIIAGIIGLLILLYGVIASIQGKRAEVAATTEALTSGINKAQANASSMADPRRWGLPAYATGTDYHPGGWAIVGERGREAVWLPRGARVLTNEQTERAMSGAPRYADGIGFGGMTIYENNEFKVDSLEDYLAIKEWHRKRQLSRRKGYAPV